MNRAERRRKDRNFKKNLEAINKLTLQQTKVVDIVATQRAQSIANKKIEEFEQLLDRNMTAAFVELDWNKDKILKFQDRMAELLLEDTEKSNNLEKENIDMKKVEETVRKAVEEVLAGGLKKKDAIAKLAFKFPKLSKSMLTNAYQNVKEEKKKELDEKATDKAVEYIFAEGEEEEKLKKELKEMKNVKSKVEGSSQKEVVAKSATVEEKAVVKENLETEYIVESEEKLEENKKEEVKGLKVLEEKVVKTIKVEGENGVYEAETGKGVILSRENASIRFENEEQLDSWVKEFKQVFKMVK
ncbi:hypothetical protein G8S49_01380 [Clostridium botulinum C]|uniref:Uncharacterized protein n=2 Tax=Clostridium botulinum TaxID=1491 RepID=A0A9Q4TND4_CLOBO|nr:hypothetical protein [Clostridium botulinum]MCD3194228.1 hypothetical protein [Clostridium botulinum C]MCD3199143.1 hypothetical protein [Clostridium botulinum C]MCD3204618.1 hypothetical protein [Clostridium botulinum C]MCD3207961.1 hypothetical protein [Clostridium botulinum C]MCD3225099.1 hypothetical protein [Clostridium botulinum C]